MHAWQWCGAHSLIVLFLLVREAAGACFHNTNCGGCISEVFAGGECVWYTRPGLEQYGSCLASHLATSADALPVLGLSQAPGDFVPIPNARWQAEFEGETTYFTVPFVDDVSLGSCIEVPCQEAATCAAGYYAIRDDACFSGDEFRSVRSLTCCRLQVNWDGFLLGFEERAHTLQGSLQHGACCAACPNGQFLSGCTAFFAGECSECPSGRYNNQNVPGPARTSCEACEPCPAGQYRSNCARANPGRCVACEAGTVKLAGLEGAWDDVCEPCPTCARGAERVECTATSLGHCQRCGNGLFNAGYCRVCDSCDEGARTGCGSTSLGVCALCTPGVNYRAANRCHQCPTCPVSNTSSNMVRVGCAGESEGECLSLEASAIQGASCETAQGSSPAACPGATLSLPWALHSSSAAHLVHGPGNCSASGTCANGLWHVVLYHRSSDSPAGYEVAELLERYLEEMNFQSVDGSGDTVHVMDTDLSLPLGLEDDAGYFMRVFFEEFGADSSFELNAQTEDFAIVGDIGAAQAQLLAADEAFLQNDRSTALALLSTLCNTGNSALLIVQIGCQRQRAIRLGLSNRGTPTSTLTLPSSVEAPTARAQEAATETRQAEAALRVWENFTAVYAEEFPTNASTWKTAVEASRSAHSGDLDFTDQVAVFVELAHDLGVELHQQADEWHEEITHVGEAVRSTLADLKTMDTMLARAAEVAGFDIIAMTQGVVQHLWESLQTEPSTAWDRLPWISHSLDLIGAATVVLIGSWRSSWSHTTGWDLQAELGDIDTWLAEAISADVLFGNDAPPSTAPLLSTTRARAWSEFRGVAELWLQRWQIELDFIGNLFADEQLVENKARAAEQMLLFVEEVTEEVLEPLTREDSRLLRGGLPEAHACEAATDGRCLRLALREFPEISVAAAMWHGLSDRSWVTAAENADRRARVAAELAALTRSRAELLDKLMLQMLDLRDMWAEPSLLQMHATTAAEASSLLQAAGTALSGAVGESTSSEATWRWEQIARRLEPGVLSGPRSARLLAYRRLQRLELLTTQVAGNDEYRVAWAMDSGNSTNYFDAIEAAVQALRVGIYLHTNSAMDTGQVLYEADSATMPLLFQCLQADNSALLRLQTTEGADHIRIRAEARAFLVPPMAATSPFSINEEATTTVPPPSSVEVSGDFIEVGLERLPGEYATLSGEASFLTMQRRTECETLNSVGDENAMWTLADGTWRLTVRDGRTHRPVHIDEGARLMLFFTAEMPSGDPPYPLLHEQSDTLYRLPFRGDCENVVSVFDPPPTARTSSIEASPQSSSSSSASAVSSSSAASSPTGTTTFQRQTNPPSNAGEDEDESALGGGSPSDESDSLGIPVSAIVVAAMMLVLFCLFLVGFYSWRHYQLRRLSRIAAVDESEDYEANAEGAAVDPLGYEAYYGQQYYQQYQHQLAQQSQEQYEQYRLQYEQYQQELLQQQCYLQPQAPQPPVPPSVQPHLSQTLSPTLSPQRGAPRAAAPRPVVQQRPPLLHLAPAKASPACVQPHTDDASSESGTSRRSSTSGSITSEAITPRAPEAATPRSQSSRSSQSLVDVSPSMMKAEAIVAGEDANSTRCSQQEDADTITAPPAPVPRTVTAALASHMWGTGNREASSTPAPQTELEHDVTPGFGEVSRAPAQPTELQRDTTPGFGEASCALPVVPPEQPAVHNSMPAFGEANRTAPIGILGGGSQAEPAMIRANSPAFGEGSMSSSFSPASKSDRLRNLAAATSEASASITGSATLPEEAPVAASQPAASGAAASSAS